MLRERDAELTSIDEALAASRSGEGQLVVVEGESGLGKTALLTAARESAGQNGMRVLSARAAELEQDFPFGVVHQLLDATVADAVEEQRELWYAGAAGLARAVLNAPTSVATQGAELYPLLHGLSWLVNALARDEPTLLVVDDLQWADAPSLAFVDFLARRLEGVPLAVLVGSRPVEQYPRPELAQVFAQRDAIRLEPAPLTEVALGQWLAEDLAEPPDREFVSACSDVTRGNPFYVRELIRDLAADGVSPSRGAADQLATRAPGGVVASVGTRLARLDPSAKAVADAVAVLGDGATVDLVAGLADVEDVGAALDALAAAGLLEGTLPPTFTHPVVRATAYSGLRVFERDRLHRKSVALLEAANAPIDLVAAHLMQTAPARDADTVSTLRRAAAGASGLGAASTAVTFLRRALEEPPPAAELPALLVELGRAAARVGEPDAEALLERALEQSRTNEERIAAGIELARVRTLTGGALASARVLQSLATPAHTVELELLALAHAGVAARTHLDEWRRGLGTPAVGESEYDLVRAASHAFGLATSVGPHQEAVAWASRVANRRPLPEGVSAASYAVLLANVSLAFCDELDGAGALADEVLIRAREVGQPLAVATAVQQTGLVAMMRGELARADAAAREALDLGRLFPTLTVLNVARGTVLWCAVERGVPDDDLRALDRATEEAQLDADSLPHVMVHHARGRVAAALGDVEGARAHLESARKHATSWGARNPETANWRSDLVRVLLLQGEPEAAHALAEEGVELARLLCGDRGVGIALTDLGVATREASAAVGVLEEAAATLETSGGRLEHARTLVELGRGLRRAGRTSSARDPLGRGRELAVGCGAQRLAEAALQELLTTGARPRRLAVSGVGALTPSERRVAELAARGLTNRVIAQQLFVSERTVENHLSRSFDKLGVRSRVQLAPLMATS